MTDAPILSSYCIYKCQQMDRNFDMDQIYFTTIEYRNHLLRLTAICATDSVVLTDYPDWHPNIVEVMFFVSQGLRMSEVDISNLI